MPEVVTIQPPVNLDAQRREAELKALMDKVQGDGNVSPNPSLPVEPVAPVEPPPETPVLPPVASVPSEPSPTPEPAPAKKEDRSGWTAEDWQREIEHYNSRLRNAQSALAPSQQKAALLKKTLDGNQETLEAMQAKMDAVLAELALLKQTPAPRQEPALSPMYRKELDPDFAELYPDLSERMELMSKGFEKRFESIQETHARELGVLRKAEEERQKLADQQRELAYSLEWEATLRKLHPDVEEYLPGTAKGQALVEWAKNFPIEYQNAIAKPRTVSPFMVGDILSRFKTAISPATPSPSRSLADLANPMLMGTAPVAVQPATPEKVLSMEELRKAPKRVEELYRLGRRAEADELVETYQRTLSQLQT